MKINMTEWAKAVIDSKKVMAVPIMTHPGIEMIGRRVIDAVSDGEVHFNAVRALAGRYDTAAATVIMDLTVEAEAFGADIAFEPDEVPAVRGHMLNSADDIARLQVPSLSAGRVPAYLKANLLAARAITDRPVLAGCIGPFSLAGRLYDMSEIMILIYQNPEAAAMLLDKCTDFILKYCIALKKTGANGVVMAEPAAGLMSDDDCMRFSSVYAQAYRRGRAGRLFHRSVTQLRQHRAVYQCHDSHRSRRISLRQQVRHGAGVASGAAHGSHHGQPRPRQSVQVCHARRDAPRHHRPAAQDEQLSKLRDIKRMRHPAAHSVCQHRRLL